MLADLPTKCPAFASECPFKSIKEENELVSKALESCPAFDGGVASGGKRCPFTECTSVEDIFEIFGKLPTTHVTLPSLPELLRLMHERTAALRSELGLDECPVFSASKAGGCPFKTLTAGGRPLVAELERASWAQMLLGNDAGWVVVSAASALSKQLKEGTKETHKAAENVHFVREFIRGRVPLAVYKAMIKDLYHVYAALEAAAHDCRAHPAFAPVHFPQQLNREEALAADLVFLHGTDWRELDECQPSAAAERYVARLRNVAAHEPELLLAHSYTRYMGDLSGGRVLMRVATRAYGFDAAAGDGLRFYKFDAIADGKAFKNAFRSALDSLDVDEPLGARLVAEANAAFAHNIELFQELDGLLGLAHVKPEPGRAGAECPFGFTSAGGNASGSALGAASGTAGRSASKSGGAGGAAGAAVEEIEISNCPVHPTFYTGRWRRLCRSVAAAALPRLAASRAAQPPLRIVVAAAFVACAAACYGPAVSLLQG